MGKAKNRMSKNSNSKFTTRNNKKDIFSKFTKFSQSKIDTAKKSIDKEQSKIEEE